MKLMAEYFLQERHHLSDSRTGIIESGIQRRSSKDGARQPNTDDTDGDLKGRVSQSAEQ